LSVLAQTYRHLEVVVVDDASEDDTSRLVKECARHDPRVRLITLRQRKGAQGARNAGISVARGRWIAFLDSDDRWLPGSVEARLDVASQKGVHVVHSDCYVLGSESEAVYRFGVPSLEGWVYAEVLRRPGPLFPSLIVSKDAFGRIGNLDEGILSFQEWDTAIRLAKYYEFGFVAEPTFVYDCRGTDAISRDLLRAATGYEQVVRKHWRPILQHCGVGGLSAHARMIARLYRRAKGEGTFYRYPCMAVLVRAFGRRLLQQSQKTPLRPRVNDEHGVL